MSTRRREAAANVGLALELNLLQNQAHANAEVAPRSRRNDSRSAPNSSLPKNVLTMKTKTLARVTPDRTPATNAPVSRGCGVLAASLAGQAWRRFVVLFGSHLLPPVR